MQKTMNRKVSLIAAILLAVEILLDLIGLLLLPTIFKDYPLGLMVAKSFLSWIPTAIAAFALYRGQKDLLAGVFFGGSAVLSLFSLFSQFTVASLLVILLYSAFAAVCLVGEKLDLNKYERYLFILGITAGVFTLLNALNIFEINNGWELLRGLFHFPSAIILRVSEVLLRGLVAAAAYVCMSLGFSNVAIQKTSRPKSVSTNTGSASPAQEDGFYSLTQANINKISQSTAPAVQATQATNYQELKELKELLDAGVITEEEFQLKKKQILGL